MQQEQSQRTEQMLVLYPRNIANCQGYCKATLEQVIDLMNKVSDIGARGVQFTFSKAKDLRALLEINWKKLLFTVIGGTVLVVTFGSNCRVVKASEDETNIFHGDESLEMYEGRRKLPKEPVFVNYDQYDSNKCPPTDSQTACHLNGVLWVDPKDGKKYLTKIVLQWVVQDPNNPSIIITKSSIVVFPGKDLQNHLLHTKYYFPGDEFNVVKKGNQVVMSGFSDGSGAVTFELDHLWSSKLYEWLNSLRTDRHATDIKAEQDRKAAKEKREKEEAAAKVKAQRDAEEAAAKRKAQPPLTEEEEANLIAAKQKELKEARAKRRKGGHVRRLTEGLAMEFENGQISLIGLQNFFVLLLLVLLAIISVFILFR